MLRITASTSAAGAKKYFGEGLVRSDYYIDGQEVPGRWGGKGAERLGLSGQVDQASYYALCDNQNPVDGTQLTPRQKDTRRVGYDFTFSAPKTVSVMYELSGDERILDAFRDAVRETMQEMESEMKTRVRKGGRDEDRITGEMTWAEFVHFTSRPVGGVPDPHLHAHMYAFNASYDPVEKQWKAGQFGDLKRDATYYEAAFDGRLSKKLEHLGYATERRGYSFELAGIGESVVNKFSQRRNLVERTAAALGITNADAKHAITRRGREKKTSECGRAELRREWDGRLEAHERAGLVDAMDGRVEKARRVTPTEAVQYAVEHVFERHSTLPEKRLKAEALRYGVGSVLPEDVARELQAGDIIRKEHEGQMVATTRDVLASEIAMLKFAREGHGRFQPLGNTDLLPGELSAEQRAAAAHVLGSHDRVVAIRGAAGTGKTFMMKATIGAIEHPTAAAGTSKRVFVFAPSAQASRGVLRDEGFAQAETLELLLANEKLQAQTRNQVLWVDEAGLVSSQSMRRLFQLAERNNNRIVLSGDYRQMSSVQAGDAFRLLESEAGVRFAELRQIRRQKPADYRKAVEWIGSGNAAGARKGFDLLDSMGAVIEASGEDRHRLLVRDYASAVREGRSALIVAPTHAEGDRITQELRTQLKAQGALGDDDRVLTARTALGWTTAQKGDARNYSPGMVVEFQQHVPGKRVSRNGRRETIRGFVRGERVAVAGVKDGRVEVVREDGTYAALPEQAKRFEVYRPRELAVATGERLRITKNLYLQGEKGRTRRLNNGDIVTVTGFTRDEGIRLDNGLVLPPGVGHITGGYVDTAPRAQGKNVQRVFIAAGDMSLPAMNAKTWYVAASRGQESMRLYVDSKQEVRDAIARSGSRLSAVELVKPVLADARRPRWRDMLERNRVVAYLRDRTHAVARSWRERTSPGQGGLQHA